MIRYLAQPFAAKLMLIGLALAGAGILSLYTWGLYWRGEARSQAAVVATLEAQGVVLAEATAACSASVARGAELGAVATATTSAMLAEARRLAAGGRATVSRLEELLKQKPPAGAGCNDAWDQIEVTEQKAGW